MVSNGTLFWKIYVTNNDFQNNKIAAQQVVPVTTTEASFLWAGHKLSPDSTFSAKAKDYRWYPRVIKEINYCNQDSLIFDDVLSYANPIDLAYMNFLNGREITSEAARRGYQESYMRAWRTEFYNVATLLYKTINYDKERTQLQTYIRSIEEFIDNKQNEMVIDINKCNSTPADQRWPSMYYGNATRCWQEEEAALIYRTEALNMIRQYNNYLYYSSESTNYNDALKYKYLTTKIVDSSDGDFKIPYYFKPE